MSSVRQGRWWRLVRGVRVASLCLAPLSAWLAFPAAACAQSQDAPIQSFIDEIRTGLYAHDVRRQQHADEKGMDVNAEVLFARPAIAYGNTFADVVLNPRFHLGTSISVNGDTSQLYAGVTWDMPLIDRFSLELSFGGSLHDDQKDWLGRGAFGCPLNFRESASVGYAVTEHWRLYATWAHMSNAGLCEPNSGITSVGGRLGYVLN